MTPLPDLALLAPDGMPPDRPDDRTRRALGLAHELGAPVREVLAARTRRHEDELRASRRIRQATAQGRATAAGLLVAPVLLGPLFGRLVGSGPPSAPVVVVAAGLWLVGALACWVLVRRAARVAPGHAQQQELLDLTLLALRSGRAIGPALRAAGSRVPALADEAARLAWWLELGGHGSPPVQPALAPRLAAAWRAGTPLVPLLDAHAGRLRAEVESTQLERAERLAVQLTVPAALLLLPAALLVLLAPLVSALIGPMG